MARTADAGSKNRISAVSFDDAGQSTTINIRGSETPTFTVYKLERPNRVVIDIAGATLADAVKDAQENGATLSVGTWAVNQVAAYELDDGGSLVRVVVTLARPGRYDVDAKDDNVVVSVVARDPAPEKIDADDVADAKAAAAKAKKESDEAKKAKGKAEKVAKEAQESADAAKQESATAKEALAEAQARAVAAEKKSKTEKAAAAKALADAKAEAERTKQAAADAKALSDKTTKTVAAAKAEAERAEAALVTARGQVETMQAELDAMKVEAAARAKEAKAAKADAKKSKADADAARADADQARKETGDAEAKAAERSKEAAKAKADAAEREAETAEAKADAAKQTEEAKAAKAEAAKDKEDAVAAKKEAKKAKAAADKLEAEALAAKAEAKKARADAEAAQAAAEQAKRDADEAKKDAASAKKEAAERKRDADAAKHDADAARAEADADHRDAAAMRAEAETMLAEAKQRFKDAEVEAKAAKKSKTAADAALAKAEKKESAARKAETKAADERVAAEEALARAEKAKKSGDRDAAKKFADAEARLAKAEKATADAESKRMKAESAAETARAEAEQRKSESADAVAARSSADREKQAAEAAADEAEQRAQRSEELRKDEVAAAKKAADARADAVQAEKDNASKKEIAAKKTEAKRLEKMAAAAKQSREAEEAQLADVIAERRQAETELATARSEKVAAEKAAETARADATSAKKKADAARADAEDAEQRAKVARAEADAAQKDAEAAKKAKATAAKVEVAQVEPKVKPKKAEPKKAEPKKKKAIAVEDVSFQQDGDAARVIVMLSGEVDPEIKTSAGRAEMVLAGVALPQKLERTLDVSKFDGAVTAVSTYTDPKDATKVRVVIELEGDSTPKLEHVGDNLHWTFTGSGAVAQKTKTKTKSKAKSKVKTDDIPAPVVGGYGASSGPVTSKSVAQSGGKRKVFRGPTINLDFKDADIHNLLRFLANIGRVSIVVPDDIKATVTVRLQRVPWDQALEVILASKGLWYRKDGNLYRVAPRKQLDEEDELEAARIKAAVQAEVPEAEVFTLNYASAEETKAKLEPLLSPKGTIEVDSRTNSLIINDIRAHRRRIIDLSARLDTQTPQIMIEARIVEARSTYSRDIGIQWGGSLNMNQNNNSSTGLIFPNSVGIAGGGEDRQTPTGGVAAPSDFAVNLPATVGTGTGGAIGLSLGSVGGTVNINLRLSAAEDEGSIRIISSPKITVLNNTEATISQGVSIPISIVSAQGTQTQFEDADLSLTVTPYVSQRDCSIAMDVHVTKNEPDFVNTGARGDPTILKKEAKTRILIADGETTVMGGITTRNTGLSYNKIPFFGDLPVVGWLFKHRRENDDRTELLIFITPKITNKAFLRCE